jgi:uncharacterized RDD family membrane protein YckC
MSDPNTPDGPPPPPTEPPRFDPPPSGEAQPVGAPPPTPPGGGYGGLGKRFGARLIDYLLVGIPVSIILGVLPGIRLGGLISNAVVAVAVFAYFLFLETSQGATFGKQWLKMAVTDESGSSPISMDASMRRNWWVLLGVLGGVPVLGALSSLASLVIVIIIAVTISSDGRNQGWHDKLGGTLVVDRA